MKMKVLHVIDSGGVYGAEMMLLSLMEEQRRTGIEPVLASIGKPGEGEKQIEAEALRRGLLVQPFRMMPGPNLSGALGLIRYARENGFDLFHCHGYKGDILLGFLPRWVLHLPIVSTVHGWTSTGKVDRMLLYEWLDAMSLARMNRAVLVNPAMREHPRIAGRGIAVEVVENGIDSARSQDVGLEPSVVEFCGKRPVIGAVGRLSREKGFDLLLEAIAGLVKGGRDLRVVILGEGAQRGALEDSLGRLGLTGRVLMPGYLPDARRYLQLFDIFTMPSLTEGLPMVLLEAMQAGVPVVASAVGGIPRLVAEGACGMLTEPGMVESIKRGIAHVLDDPGAAAAMARAAQERVAGRYSAAAMAKGYRAVYDKVVGEQT